MAITTSRSTLGFDREALREGAGSRGRASLMRKGLRQAKKEKNYEKALGFANALEGEGQAYGMTGSAEDVSSLAGGRVAARDALSAQMRAQLPAVTGQTREAKIAAAKAAGTFDATRTKYNEAAKASGKMMDEAGNIVDLPKETTPPPAGTTPPPPAGTTPPPPAGGTPPAGTTPPPPAGAKPAAPLSPRERLKTAINEGRITVDGKSEAERLAGLASEATTPTDKKRDKRERLLAKGRAMASPLTRTRPGLPTFRTA